MAAVTICSDFGAPQNKVWHCFYCFPSISHEVMGPDAMIFVFWMLSFKPTFSLSSFTFITSLAAQRVKRLSTIQETRVQSLSREDPLEKEMAIHSSTIAWKIPWTEELGRLQSRGSHRVGHDWVTSLSLSLCPNFCLKILLCFCTHFLSCLW